MEAALYLNELPFVSYPVSVELQDHVRFIATDRFYSQDLIPAIRVFRQDGCFENNLLN